MTWPTHGTGSTTPEDGREDPDYEDYEDPDSPRRGRHAYPDPLPPLDGPVLGGGPTAAETTLPMALSWPAPPARSSRAPRPGPPGGPAPEAPDAPPGWRRAAGPPGGPAGGSRPPRGARPGYPQPTFRPSAPPGAPQPTFTPTAPGALQPTFTPTPTPPAPTAAPPTAPIAPPGPAAAPPRPPGPVGPRPPGRAPGAPAPPARGRSDLLRSSAGMAVGTLISRGTGFLRTLVLLYALGSVAVSNAYNNANNLPNTIYYLLLGGVFTSVIVPLLVRAAKRYPDNGEAYAQRIFTLGVLALLGVTIVGTVFAAPIADLYAGSITGSERHVMIIWAYFFMPQIFFYGMNALIGAVLNTRGSFAAPMWTPTVNNVVVIVLGSLYIVSGLDKSATTISSSGVLLLAFGTTAGIVLQTAALYPSLRRVGFRWRPALGFQPGELGEIRQMAGWMSAYVVTQAAGYLVVQIIANKASIGHQAEGYSAYAYAWQLFQLPYAIIGISVITALLPRMSEHAGGRRYSQVREDFSTGIRLSSVIVVPAAIYLFVLGGPLAEFLLAHGRETVTEARYIGEVFGLFSLGLIPYMVTQLQLRVFYSFRDSRTAALVGLLTMCLGIAGALIALAVLPGADVVAGLAVVYGVANLAGALAGWILLLRRVGSLDGWAVSRSLARMHLATVPGLLFALLVMYGAGHLVKDPSRVYGLLVTVIGGGGAILLYAACARKLRIAEFGFLLGTVTAKFGGQIGRQRSRRH
jgi:putative peptidoglycan lipid II flippase